MPVNLIADQALARIAVWTGSANDLGPVINPKAYPDRVKLNTALDIIGFRRTRYTGTVSLMSRDWVGPIKLFDHGLAYTPILWGWVVVGGIKLPVRGTVLAVESNGARAAYSVAANASSVYIQRMELNAGSRVSSGGISSTNHQITIPYELIVSNYGVNAAGAAFKPPFYPDVDINSGAVNPYTRAGYFDTLSWAYPYVKTTGDMILTSGRTISFGVGVRVSTGYAAVGYRYEVAGYAVSDPLYTGYDPAFTSSYKRVAIPA